MLFFQIFFIFYFLECREVIERFSVISCSGKRKLLNLPENFIIYAENESFLEKIENLLE